MAKEELKERLITLSNTRTEAQCVKLKDGTEIIAAQFKFEKPYSVFSYFNAKGVYQLANPEGFTQEQIMANPANWSTRSFEDIEDFC